MASSSKTVFAQFTQARSIHRGFYKRKTMDNNPKKFIPQLATDTENFHRAFAGAVCAPYCAIGNSIPETGKTF